MHDTKVKVCLVISKICPKFVSYEKLSNYLLAAFVAFAVLAGKWKAKHWNNYRSFPENMKSAFAPDRGRKSMILLLKNKKDQRVTSQGELPPNPEVLPALIAAAASQGITLTDSVTVLPDPALGESVYGVTSLSVVSHRYEPRHASESATQTLMGTPLRILQERGWSMVKTPEGYIAWALLPGNGRWTDLPTKNGWLLLK